MPIAMNPSEVGRELPDGIRPLRRVEYEQLASTGCFDDERIELLFGQLVEMTPPDPRHEQSVNRLGRLLIQQLGARAEVRVNSAFAANDDSEPQPDVVIAPAGDYWTENPSRALLVVEVSYSSLRKDRGLKARLYAGCAVDEYWIVDVAGGVVEVYRAPLGDGRWGEVRIHGRGARLSPAAWPDVEIVVDKILPPP